MKKKIVVTLSIIIIIIIIIALAIMVFMGKVDEPVVLEEIVVEESDVDVLYNKLKGTCVSIQTDRLSGQGNVLSIDGNEVKFVTARHVVEYADKIVVRFQGEVIGDVEVDYLSEQYDFAIVRLQLEKIPEGMVSVEFPSQKLLYEDSMVILPLTDKYVLGNVIELEGYFPEFNSHLNRHLMVVKPGMSGAGIFDEFGYYEGVVVGGLEEESVSLPCNVIMEVYK